MRKRLLGSLTVLLAGAGLALAQPAPRPQPGDQAPAPPPAVANSPDQPDRAVLPAPGAVPAPPPGAPPAPAGEKRSPYWPVCNGCAGPGPFCPTCGTCPTPAGAAKQDIHEIVWGSAEYLVWWVKDGPLTTPLVTTGTPAGLGVLGAPGTGTIFGDSDLEYYAFSGGRFTVGVWLDPCNQTWGLEGTGFFLEKRAQMFLAHSSATGTPVLARPFLNAVTGAEDALLVSAPGQFAGAVMVDSESHFYGWEANFIRPNLFSQNQLKVDLLAGVRYLHLEEDLGIAQTSGLLPGGTASFVGNVITPPGFISVVDRFATRNEFYGGQFGIRADYRFGCWSVDGRAKLALGNSHEIVNIDGISRLFGTATAAGATGTAGVTTVPGGLFASTSNIGRYAHDRFAAVPEVGFNVAYHFKPGWSVFMGYTLIYDSDVVRPGEQIDRVVNPTQVPASQAYGIPVGPARPVAAVPRTDFWATGLNFGFELRY